MKFTAEDIRRQMQQTNPGINQLPQIDAGMESLLGSMATAAQNSLLEACPTLIDRLRSSPQLAQKLKELMQNWGKEEAAGSE